MHQLNPDLNKEKWTIDDNKLLFNLHKTYKSHWKKIAEHFNGRTDNSIKNQFFSVVRKALRKACKVLGNVSNTNTINKIKPKVLSNYLSLDYDIPVKGDGKGSVKVCFNEFVQQFAFSKYHELARNVTDNDLIIIRGCIDYLNNLNDGYVKKKKKITKKPLKKISHASFKRVEPETIYEEMKARTPQNNIDVLQPLPDAIKPLVEQRILLNDETDTSNEILKKFEELFRNNGRLDSCQENPKDRLIGFFSDLGELSYKVKNMLLNSSDSDKDPLTLSNFFSVASKTRKFFDFDDNDNNHKDKNPLLISNDDYNLKKLTDIFVVPDNNLTHQLNHPHLSANFQNNSVDGNKHMEQFNKFFQHSENVEMPQAQSIDFGISDRFGLSKLNSILDNQSHVEVMFNEYGFGSLAHQKVDPEPRKIGGRTPEGLYRSKTHSYAEKNFEQFRDI